MSTELKPCPFCDCALTVHPLYANQWRHRDGIYQECPLAGKVITDVEKWNTRAPDPRIKELEEKIKTLTDLHKGKLDRVHAKLMSASGCPSRALVYAIIQDAKYIIKS